MNTKKSLILPFLSVAALLLLATPVLAGGGLVSFEVIPDFPKSGRLAPGEFYTLKATSYLDNSYTARCQNCPITFKLENSNSSDVITQDSATTDSNGQASAKLISYVFGDRLAYAEVGMPDGNIYISSSYVLAYNAGPTTDYSAPEMVYPQDYQILDLEGAYMFKVKPVQGASGYLFGLFQDEIMVYENYRDAKTLSANGEFALWESNPGHSKFKTGPVKVMIRALISNEWTDARTITIYLRPRGSQDAVPTIIPVPVPTTSPVLPTIPPSQTIVIIRDSSASAQLQKKVEELEQKLQESQEKQSVLESRLEQIINWIKSIFPFFE